MKTVYKTHDGSEFESRVKAERHENQLFKEWLGSDPTISVQELLGVLDSGSVNNFHASDAGVGEYCLRQLWNSTGS